MRRRKWIVVLGVMAVTSITSGCIGLTGATAQVTGYDFPDPAAVALGLGIDQLYSTRSLSGSSCTWRNVPSLSVVSASGSPATNISTLHDALPTLPSWNVRNRNDPAASCSSPGVLVWAPTVRYVAGRYLMMWGGSRADGSMCIGAATASDATKTFTPTSVKWCDAPNVGWLDPQLYVEGSSVWLLFSRQWRGGNGCLQSEVVAQQLTSNGLGLVGTYQRLVSFDQVKGVGGPTDCNSVVENPMLVKDPYNGYDLVVSVGTWNGSYRTVEVPCLSVNGNCLPEKGGVLISANNAGGMSSNRDDTSGRVYWHDTGFFARPAKSSSTGFVNLNCSVGGFC